MKQAPYYAPLKDKRVFYVTQDIHIRPGMSSSHINTALSAICKATDAHMRDYDKPARRVSEIERGKGERTNDALNDKKAATILRANQLLGMLRSELKSLRSGDIFERGDTVVVKAIGKGGRYNE